ncbi:mediator of RNA polymerase II transcription subunit 12 [Andrographis paniculata]|uniref:mediator of RNA polymerase II transcription subunit 12 n=1 Tax=Andrographis paniculata TaxID=175694 RepID=UPI0021E9A187|nr:mediator of RNA polymerase II transcription subunit 12 [Andrographis paniculata]XP_051147368.1 mediator of RNA polymerase II transcription subunit 12 [Andrographis paniculata]
MQRYHAGSCNTAVNSNAIGGIQGRETSRSDSSSVPPNFSVNSRRSSQLTPYKLRCEKDQLNPRLGPPDFHPQTPTCPEETLTRDYVQTGYTETVEGLEEARELLLSQVHSFKEPIVVKCKEAIRKCHRAINESRAQKRKAGQVYGLPLSGTLLTKPGIFPEQRPCGEDFRKKWIEGLSQPHKRLRSLAEHVPHGYRRKSLFEVLIRNNVPLLRATWFIKVTYLNQVRPSSNFTSGSHDKHQISRSDQWTKDVIDYLHYLLDEFVTRNNSHSTLHMRDRSAQMVFVGSVQQKGDSFPSVIDSEEPSLHTKWWYVVRLIHWHHSEGLIVPSLVIDWVLNQLQEKDALSVLQLLLPIIYGVIETVVSCQTYVRTLVGIAVRFIREPSPGGSDLVENSRRAYTTAAVVEMLRYLILAVPDTFVALDCFPLPTCVTTQVVNDGSFISKMTEDARKVKLGQTDIAGPLRDRNHEVQVESLSFQSAVASIKKRAETLATAARPSHSGQNVAKALELLDQALMHGDIGVSYSLLLENSWEGVCAERWSAEVSPCLYTSLKHISVATSSLLCSTFFICEWATCEFRDFRTAPPHGLKLTGRRDYSQVLIATRLLKLKMKNLPNLYSSNRKIKNISDVFSSPSPLHDIIVCWIDQHEVHNREGFKRLQLLIREFIRYGIFNPMAYARQLIVSGIMDGNGPMANLEKWNRHYKLLKQLPAPYVQDALQEAHTVESSTLVEAMAVYSDERRLLLHGLSGHSKSSSGTKSAAKKRKYHLRSESGSASSSVDQWYFQAMPNISTVDVDADIKLEDLKSSISVLLQLPHSTPLIEAGVDESKGGIKRTGGAYYGNGGREETSECEECRRIKKQKLSEEWSSVNQVDDDEMWWVGKGSKPHPKPTKQMPKSRQKPPRKTQSLAQLAASRIEGSQGASTSHVCESRVGCLHQRTDSDAAKPVDGKSNPPSRDIVSIGKNLKQMRSVEKRILIVWLLSAVKQLIEEAEKTAPKIGQYGRSYPAADDRSSTKWRLGEDELSAILYIMDACNEFVSATRFLLWLLPKIPCSPSSAISSRNIMILPRTSENNPCDVGEAFLLSSMRSYENVIVAADLIPEMLSTTMHRAATLFASKGRITGSPALVYSQRLRRKYSNVSSVIEWERTFKSSYDKRFTTEMNSGRSFEGEYGYTLGNTNGGEDLDDSIRQKLNGPPASRLRMNMKEIVKVNVDKALHFYSKERKPLGAGINSSMDKRDDCYEIAHQIVAGLMDCIRQTGGAAQEGDPSLVSSAISAIMCGVVRVPELTGSTNHAHGQQLNHSNAPPTSGLHFAWRILHVLITCLSILKDALGERQTRALEIALAREASATLMQAYSSGKVSRAQFQMSPETHDLNPNLPNESLNHSKSVLGSAEKITAAVSAFVVGAILQGVTSLDRMVTVFKLKDGLDLIQFARSMKSNTNGSSVRSGGVLKVDSLVAVSANWFRVLVGNCRTVADGFLVELLGEASIATLSRMQRMLSLNLVFPPAYSMFAFLIWKPILDASFGSRDEFHQCYQLLAKTLSDAVKHVPFREICFRDTYRLYDLMAADSLDAEFVSLLESAGSDNYLKAAALAPLRSRLFLDALIDCKLPVPVGKLDGGNWISGPGELIKQCDENVKKLMSKLVLVLDTLQPAKFHWQWVELRLLLNEQAVNEKMVNDVSLSDAIRSLSSHPDKSTASDNESHFVQIILTRLLVRPDAAPLFSEAVHLLGKSLEDSMLSQAKWLLSGAEVLFGKKSIRQKVMNIATELKELSLKPQYWKPWGWCHTNDSSTAQRRERWKSESGALEEGEVADDGGRDSSPFGKRYGVDFEGFISSQQHLTERALIELILPCLDQSSDDLRKNFAHEMIKQMTNIEQQINAITRGVYKLSGTPNSAIGSPASKGGTRKSGKSGSPGISRQSTGSADAIPPSPAALRASMILRLQILLRLLPIICADREPSGRNMRYNLAYVILRLLGSRAVHADSSHSVATALISSKRDTASLIETCSAAALMSGESLFDYLLLVLHALLSSHQPSWLKPKPDAKLADYAVIFDREMSESLQNELDRMELPDTIRWRIQTAMPILTPSSFGLISCEPPSVPSTALACLQPSNLVTTLNPTSSSLSQKTPVLPGRSKSKQQQQQDLDPEINLWTLLEDGAGSGQPSPNSAVVGGNDQVNLKASPWLKGAVRVRRGDLTYVGAVDEDS